MGIVELREKRCDFLGLEEGITAIPKKKNRNPRSSFGTKEGGQIEGVFPQHQMPNSNTGKVYILLHSWFLKAPVVNKDGCY